jgi:DNA (cytosine-5)-methyltransferase 1
VHSSAKITAVDVFCGAGGLSLGLQRSGISIAAGIDLDPACRYPFEENIGAHFIEQDAFATDPQAVRALFRDAKISVLAGCAPCQPFSGYTTRRREVDDRWQLLLEFLRIAEGAQPDIVTLENVPRLSLLPLWGQFIAGLNASGYTVTWGLLDASDYGVPQKRKRLVLLGSKFGPIELPPASKGNPPTVRLAIGGLPKTQAGQPFAGDPLHSSRALTARNLERIQNSRQAGTWRDWPKRMQVDCHKNERGRTYPSVYGRMSWDAPAPTITTQFYGFGNGRFGHPEQDRAISLREGAILQSFPSDFKFHPAGGPARLNFREIGRLIGNAVPPKLGSAIGKVISDHVHSYVL